MGPGGKRQERSANEAKEKEVGLGSPAAPESGALSPEVVSFHSRRRARGAPLRRPPSHATTHRALIRPNAPQVLIGCKEGTAEAGEPGRLCKCRPQFGSGRWAPPPARACTFYSPVRRSAKCLQAGSQRDTERFKAIAVGWTEKNQGWD